MNCPLYHGDVTNAPENKERWAPPSPLIGMCFQLHDSVLTLYRVAHTKDAARRKEALLSSLQPIEADLAFIKKEVAKL